MVISLLRNANGLVMALKQVTRDMLMKMMDAEEDFILIDARTHEGYDKERLPGAISIPADRLGERIVRQYKKDRTIVTYCSGWSCESSTIAAKKLEKLGFTRVLEYKGGLEDWKKAGFPLEKG